MRTLILLAVLVWALPGLAEANRTITVEGSGTLSVAPDQASFRLEIMRQSMDARDAQSEVEALTAALIDGIRDLPLVEDSLTAAHLNVAPQYGWEADRRTRTFEGYRVSRRVSFTINQLDAMGRAYHLLTDLGASSIEPAQLGTRDRDAQSKRALAAAFADARQEASTLAQAADLKLGEPISIDATAMQVVRAPMMARAAMLESSDSSSGVYEPGLIEFNRKVVVVFEVSGSE